MFQRCQGVSVIRLRSDTSSRTNAWPVYFAYPCSIVGYLEAFYSIILDLDIWWALK